MRKDQKKKSSKKKEYIFLKIPLPIKDFNITSSYNEDFTNDLVTKLQ